jgi:SHS2 domain-containing protein
MFETFDHTADLGLRIRAASLDELFADAAKALYSTIIEDAASIAPRERLELLVAGTDREYLLFDWLKLLLYQFDAEHWLFCRFDVHVDSDGLRAVVWGEPIDWDRHVLGHEVKAITNHGLKVEKSEEGWLAEVIVDI